MTTLFRTAASRFCATVGFDAINFTPFTKTKVHAAAPNLTTHISPKSAVSSTVVLPRDSTIARPIDSQTVREEALLNSGMFVGAQSRSGINHGQSNRLHSTPATN